ncbi:hypothetical protein [Mumia zhuanghuii]|uniref:hypothetical protein n=1 Tax=Mumia zhuanghuii TaxID=2585211 RepID=UPI001E3B1201|nr:hypothetical protein [Mumia zhuanghuii]
MLPAPGWVKPSMVTGSVICGSSDVGEIVTGPEPMAKRIVSAPPPAFASWIAARRVQTAPVAALVRHWPSPGVASA